MTPEDVDLNQFNEYVAANEYGLALEELSHLVNHNGNVLDVQSGENQVSVNH